MTVDVDDLNRYTYNGEDYDYNTGLQYLRARYYNTSVGSFISQDTYLGQTISPLSQNRYTYCGNNPIAFDDPSGHNYQTVTDELEDPVQIDEFYRKAYEDGENRIKRTTTLEEFAKDAQKMSRLVTCLENLISDDSLIDWILFTPKQWAIKLALDAMTNKNATEQEIAQYNEIMKLLRESSRDASKYLNFESVYGANTSDSDAMICNYWFSFELFTTENIINKHKMDLKLIFTMDLIGLILPPVGFLGGLMSLVESTEQGEPIESVLPEYLISTAGDEVLNKLEGHLPNLVGYLVQISELIDTGKQIRNENRTFYNHQAYPDADVVTVYPGQSYLSISAPNGNYYFYFYGDVLIMMDKTRN